MSRHPQLWWPLYVVAVLLLAACQVGGKSAADKQYELRVACLASGKAWHSTSNSCVGPPTPQPTATPRPQPTATPRPQPTDTPTLQALTDEELNLRDKREDWSTAALLCNVLHDAAISSYASLKVRVRESGKQSNAFLDEFEDELEAYQDGSYMFVIGGNLPRFSEVLGINDRIEALVEAELRMRKLYIEYLKEVKSKSRSDELFDRTEALQEQNNREHTLIRAAITDLVTAWILDPRIPLRMSSIVIPAE